MVTNGHGHGSWSRASHEQMRGFIEVGPAIISPSLALVDKMSNLRVGVGGRKLDKMSNLGTFITPQASGFYPPHN